MDFPQKKVKKNNSVKGLELHLFFLPHLKVLDLSITGLALSSLLLDLGCLVKAQYVSRLLTFSIKENIAEILP